ncbi:ribonuclease T [Blochmannia endosymbiont of Camponotus modoc]|uniref:ribonuclease T n=1 Tax=Blochmannia endosymbiont of Camponotus modoc TaxID=2945587 RepID=UPI00202576E8|nr:ribonuclease T [Blochmannia endosymbiont of Camponotus modoc]URJ31549.1 ribonuclease T [Blochmannia endosymbiont of Camponotus modoc]
MICKDDRNTLRARFRGFYPVVVDVETAGLNANINALLEIAVATLKMDEYGWLCVDGSLNFHIKSFPGAIIQPESLAFNGIDLNSPLRAAVTEQEALHEIFEMVHQGIETQGCSRAIIVAHNAFFDHSFLMAAVERVSFMENNPFHPFVMFDTATLSGLVFGQTVLAKACACAGVLFDKNKAHSALYDTERTAMLFCELVNKWKRLGGWPLTPCCAES